MRRFRKRLLIWQVSGEVVSEFLQGVNVSILAGEQGTQSLPRIYVLYVEKTDNSTERSNYICC